MPRILLQIAAGILGLYLAQRFVPGVNLAALAGQNFWLILALAGGSLGLMNVIIKPILKALTLPLRIITFGLFSFVINALMVWLSDVIFPQLTIQGVIPLLWTTVIVRVINWLLPKR